MLMLMSVGGTAIKKHALFVYAVVFCIVAAADETFKSTTSTTRQPHSIRS